MSKVSALLLSLLAACAPRAQTPSEPPEPVEVAQRTLDATVKIELYGGHGSGFFVAPGVVLTAAHVTEGLYDLPRIKTRTGDSCEFVRGESLVGYDAALIWVDGCDEVPHLELGPPPQEGAEVWLAGAPLDAEWSITRGIVADADHRAAFGRTLVLDAVGHPGVSGGPTADYRGRAIGVTVRIMSLGAGSWVGKTFATPISEIRESLAANGVE